MIEIFDRSRKRVAIAENAHGISEQRRINSLWHLYFSLPYRDQKAAYCQPFHYVRHNGGELYRIMPEALSVDESGSVAYQCEHVLATLIDNVLFGYHVVGNIGTYTADVIRYVLDHQIVKNWVLDECDYRNQFEYGWEQESLLSALFSVAAPLAGPYMWVPNTAVYPWRLSLKRLDTAGRPEMYIRRRHNMTSYRRGKDPQNIVTRLYPLGYGEGVNQLGIGSVNGGVPYLQSPKAITDKYGIIERVWTDRRYEDPSSLKAAAQAMLDELQEPLVSYEVGYQEMTASDFDKAEIGKRLRIVHPEIGESVDTFITELKKDYEDVERSALVVANKETSIASSLADMADRQRIEQTYAQGATQIYSQALQANCDANSGAVMDFFIPKEMRIVNKVLVKVRMSKFRAYSKSTETAASQVVTSSTTDDQTKTSSDGGATKTTSTSGGGSQATSSSGGGIQATSSSGGGSVATTTTSNQQSTSSASVVLRADNVQTDDAVSQGAAVHNHGLRNGVKLAIWGGVTGDGTVKSDGYATWVPSGAHSHGSHSHKVDIPGHNHSVTIQGHTHEVNIPGHTHNVSIPNHTHEVNTPNHTHTVTISGHSHKVPVPAHSHSITPGIYQYGDPQKFGLYVNGTKKADFSGRTAELDVTDLLTGSDHMIPRGSWLSLEVRPDDLAYISIDLIIQGFVQSRGDKTV